MMRTDSRLCFSGRTVVAGSAAKGAAARKACKGACSLDSPPRRGNVLFRWGRAVMMAACWLTVGIGTAWGGDKPDAADWGSEEFIDKVSWNADNGYFQFQCKFADNQGKGDNHYLYHVTANVGASDIFQMGAVYIAGTTTLDDECKYYWVKRLKADDEGVLQGCESGYNINTNSWEAIWQAPLSTASSDLKNTADGKNRPAYSRAFYKRYAGGGEEYRANIVWYPHLTFTQDETYKTITAKLTNMSVTTASFTSLAGDGYTTINTAGYTKDFTVYPPYTNKMNSVSLNNATFTFNTSLSVVCPWYIYASGSNTVAVSGSKTYDGNNRWTPTEAKYYTENWEVQTIATRTYWSSTGSSQTGWIKVVSDRVALPKVAVLNSNPTAEINQKDGTIKVSWSVQNPASTGSGSIVNFGKFDVYVSVDGGSYMDVNDIDGQDDAPAWSGSTTKYSYTYRITNPDKNVTTPVQHSYRFCIGRNNYGLSSKVPGKPTANDNKFFIRETGTVSMYTSYTYPSGAILNLDDGRLYFSQAAGIEPSTLKWSLFIDRTEPGDQTTDITSTKTKNDATDETYKSYNWYVSSGIQPCDPTSYTLKTLTSDNSTVGSYALSGLRPDNGNRKVSSFKASKGYYNNKVDLEWNIPKDATDFLGFRIYRRVVGEPESTKRAIYSDETYNHSTYVLLSNGEGGVGTIAPGTYYEYQLYGLSKCTEGIEETKMGTDYGYASATGSISGKITYGSGQTVQNADVTFSSNSKLGQNRALLVDSASQLIVPTPYAADTLTSFTMQVWTKLTSRTGADENTLLLRSFQTGTGTLALEVFLTPARELRVRLAGATATDVVCGTVPPDTAYSHITVAMSYAGGAWTIRGYINGRLTGSRTQAVANTMKMQQVTMLPESNAPDSYVDELRFFTRTLDSTEVRDTYDRYIPTSVDGLVGYYRFDEPNGVGTWCYDVSANENAPNENHAYYTAGSSRTGNVPSERQLAMRAKTDAAGNYNSGFVLPYGLNGTSYTVTPILGVHDFSPKNQVFTISASEANQSGVNFTDISSFDYCGTVVYQRGSYPIEGCTFSVDNTIQTDKDGRPITSGQGGEFKLSVPIGVHTLKVIKQGHTFANGGTITRMFDDDVTDYTARFFDSTRVRLVGRVVGGTAQSSLPLGFGQSKANVGPSKIVMTAEGTQGNFLQDAQGDAIDTTYTYVMFGGDTCTVKYYARTITITTGAKTGEYYADLPPEKYNYNILYNVNYQDSYFGGTLRPWDLTTKTFADSSLRTYLRITRTDTVTPYPLTNPDYKLVTTHTDSILFNDTLCYTHRVTPDLTVLELNERGRPKYFSQADSTEAISGKPYYGESVMFYREGGAPKTDTIRLIRWSTQLINQDGSYGAPQYYFHDPSATDAPEGYPAYTQNKLYRYRISVAETYNNWTLPEGNPNKYDYVPVGNKDVDVLNGMAQDQSRQRLYTDSTGWCDYSFVCYAPDVTDGLLSLQVSTSSTASVYPTFLQSTIVVGGVSSDQKNFVTQGPDQVFFVLRDPPGSNSYAYWETGSTIQISRGYTIKQDFMGGAMTMVEMGAETNFISIAGPTPGALVGTSTDANYTNNLGAGIYGREEFNEEGKKVTTITMRQRVETSSDPDFVGPDADVFVGASTNMLYGYNDAVQVGNADVVGNSFIEGPNTLASGGSYFFESGWGKKLYIGKSQAIGMGESFNTTFFYTQHMIRDILIPEWKELIRNKLNTTDLTTQQKQALTAPYYYSYRRKEDAKFGKPNTPGVPNDSYIIYLPDGWDALQRMAYLDTVAYYNQQIAGWENTLAMNEKAKLDARQNSNFNYSFGDGVSIDYSKLIDTANNKSSAYSEGCTQKSEGNIGVEIAGVGMQVAVTQEMNYMKAKTEEANSSSSQMVGFVLATTGLDNKLTVDIYEGVTVEQRCEGTNCELYNPESLTGGYVFVTRGGQTSCPYHGKDVTEFYQPGTELNAATMPTEVPHLEMVSGSSNIVSGVPADGKAVYRISMRNANNTETDGWFNLRVDGRSNPNGAVVRMDGAVITENGQPIMVPHGEAVTKIITIERGPVAYKYDSIRLVMASQCQYDVVNSANDIYDDIKLTATFQQGCSNILLAEPLNYWTLNAENQLGDTLTLAMSGFDPNWDNLGWVELQWKDSYSSTWKSMSRTYVSNDAYIKQNTNYPGEMLPSNFSGKLTYRWDMHNLPDGNYDVRAVATCYADNVEIAQVTTPAASGVKDVVRPTPFGRPEPKDGVLDINDEIMIQFNEPISSAITKTGTADDDIKVTGVLSEGEGARFPHNAAVRTNGGANALIGQSDVTLTAPFTVSMWFRPSAANNDGKEHVLFSHANDLRIAVVNNSIVRVTMGGKTAGLYAGYQTSKGDTVAFVHPVGGANWVLLSVVFDEKGNVYGYGGYSDTEFSFDGSGFGRYSKTGRIVVGNTSAGSDGFGGDIHNLQIWNVARSRADIFAMKNTVYAGTEAGLTHLYRMDELEGSVATDRAGGSNLELKGAEWSLTNPGMAVKINRGQALKLPASAVSLTQESDFTVEMWFKGALGQTNATLFSAGNGNGSDMAFASGQVPINSSANNLSLFFNAAGRLTLTANGHTYNAAGTYLDSKWHHVALSVNRQGTTVLYVDGQARITASSAEIGGMIPPDNSFYIGQRCWRASVSESDNCTIDNPFEGWVDEIRIWGAALDAASVKELKYQRLDTALAVGLLAYYPLETYGLAGDNTPMVVANLTDFAPKEGNSKVYTAVLTDGTAPQATDCAPVKMDGPTKPLAFSYVVNGDKLLISLTDARYRLEKNTVTITVDDIRDLNGNPMKSAVIWTAYIDQTQLRWDAKNIELEGLPTDNISQTISIHNTGGTAETYTIADIPTWLRVSPSGGTLAPQSSATITLSVVPGTPVGRYEQVLLLNGKSVDQLTVGLNIRNQGPDWSVNPAQYEKSANIIASLLIDSAYSVNTNDRLAVFAGSECRGTANVSFDATYNRYLVYMTLYSDDFSQDIFTYRIWDDKRSTMRTAFTDASLDWANSNAFGSVNAPVVFSTTGENVSTISFAQGWTWISLNTAQTDMSVNSLLANVSDRATIVKGRNEFSVPVSGMWQGDLTTLGNRNMYKVQLRSAASLPVQGRPVDPAAEPITIDTLGWSWIAYTPQQPMTLTEALSGLTPTEGDLIKDQTSFAMYSGGRWAGSLAMLAPGRGYVYQSHSIVVKTFTYPAPTEEAGEEGATLTAERTARYPRPMAASTEHFTVVNPGKYSDNMSIIAVVTEGGQQLTNAEVGLFAGDECRGAGKTASDGRLFISVGGEASVSLSVKVYRSGETITLPASQNVAYITDALMGYPTPHEFIVSSVTNPNQPKVLSVTVTPSVATLTAGEAQQLAAAVQVENNADTTVRWSIAGNTSTLTTVSTTGLLTIGSNEIATAITVTATSIVDNTKKGSATVTVGATSVQPKVISVAVSSASASVEVGKTLQLSATVTVEGGAAQTVTWAVSGNASPQTNVSATGLLAVGSNETAGSLTVTATSTADNTKKGTATIAVKKGETAVAATGLAALALYPNPTTGQLTIANYQLTIGDKVSVYSTTGTLVKQFVARNSQCTVDISSLPAGTYIVKVGNAVGTVVKQ